MARLKDRTELRDTPKAAEALTAVPAANRRKKEE